METVLTVCGATASGVDCDTHPDIGNGKTVATWSGERKAVGTHGTGNDARKES